MVAAAARLEPDGFAKRREAWMAPTNRKPFKIGLVLPSAEGSLDGGTPRWSDIVAIARLAEDAGFDSLWLPGPLALPLPEERRRVGRGTAGRCWRLWRQPPPRVALGPS